MSNTLIITIIICIGLTPVDAGSADDDRVAIREDFNDIDNWSPLTFPKIKAHSKYSIDRSGEGSYLKAESRASASGIIFKREFKVYEFPKVRWRWKVSNVFKKGNAMEKSGDDYPLRVYIIFKYDPDTASFGQKIKYGLAKSIYGEYPPHSSLNYIWANKERGENIIPNPYASEAMMIPLQAGDEHIGQWVEEEIDIIEDYHRAFGEDPPDSGSLAIMNDSDNTGEAAVSFMDYIEVYR